MPQPRAFIINVGVNASHGALRSPLFDDGTFTFVPIPEKPEYQPFECLPIYRDVLPARALACVPSKFHDRRAHDDPEFVTFTYGDYPGSKPRAAMLKRIAEGDHIFFLARLVRWHSPDRQWGEPGFYIVAFVVVEEVVRDISPDTPESNLRRVGRNAHVKRLATGQGQPCFSVIKGSSESRLLTIPLPFDRQLTDRVMRDRNGQPWRWDPRRSPLQIIGSYTRSCRMIEDPERAGMLIGTARSHAELSVDPR